MVKIAEKQKKRSPLAAIYGLLLVVGLFGIAYVLTTEVIIKIPAVRPSLGGLDMQAKLLLTFGVWIILLGLAFFVVAILSGKDPESSAQIPLPPKGKDKRR
jgi:hypothetical protein